MENLIKPADYAIQLGISRQAVYAKIKKGILPSRNIDGKIYILLDKNDQNTVKNNPSGSISSPKVTQSDNHHKLLAAKDETISVLKETITDLKETNKMITSTLRGEVELLKEAFGEMKMLYGLQLEHKPDIEVQSIQDTKSTHNKWITTKELFEKHKIKKKKQDKIKKLLKKEFKKGNIEINKKDGKLIILSTINLQKLIKK